MNELPSANVQARLNELPSEALPDKLVVGRKSYTLLPPDDCESSIQVPVAGRAFYITKVDEANFAELVKADKTGLMQGRAINSQCAVQLSWSDNCEVAFGVARMIAFWA